MKKLQYLDAYEEFFGSELGDEFSSVEDPNEHGICEAEVGNGFVYRDMRFNEGDKVLVDLNDDSITMAPL